MIEVSVIICTHNPKYEYLRRTLNALKAQSIHYTRWELILVDNDSDQLILEKWDLSWHPNSHHLNEEKRGLTNARLRGIKSATGKLLVFVDDDNELNPDYLENAINIAEKYPNIGAFGGSQIGDFEKSPPEWMMPYLSVLAIRDVDHDIWSNLYNWETTPAGAGLVLRIEVALEYMNKSTSNKLKRSLGRKGSNTISGEDVDMAYTAIDMGMGCGRFKALSLIHIIPEQRIEEEYFFRLYKGIQDSKHLLNKIRDENYIPPISNPVKINLKRLYYFLFKPKIVFRINEIVLKSNKDARDI